MGLMAGSELRLVADPTRSRILRSILQDPNGRRRVGPLAVELALTQPTVSHHVKALLDEGLLERHPDGRTAWYSIAPAHAGRLAELVDVSPETPVTDATLERISHDLAARFAGTVGVETVARFVAESHALLADRTPKPQRLASRTAHFAAERLAALATAGARTATGRPPEVLFVCVQNAGRSQLAAGILRHLAGERVHVRTAGSAPADSVRSVIVTVLDEIGAPIGGEYPKPLTDEVVRAADVVVTMGCGDACPVYPGRLYLDWDLDDPVGMPIARVRDIRDDIENRVRELLDTLNRGTP